MNKEQFHLWRQKAVVQTVQSITYCGKPLIMGVLNVTPDSFSDGGYFLETEKACARAREMIEQGVDIIDVGGESTKPGAKPISSEEELQRVLPIIKHIRNISDICISIDTYKAEVMEAAAGAGVSLINDICALKSAESMAAAAKLNLPVCLMHMRGMPESMQNNPMYDNDVVDEIDSFFTQRIAACLAAGISREQLILDPGFGFGKSVSHNLSIVKKLSEFQHHQLPLLLGASRKSTIGAVLQKPVDGRLIGSLATAIFAALQGVSIIRTHDVDETNQALQMVDAIVTNQVLCEVKG